MLVAVPIGFLFRSAHFAKHNYFTPPMNLTSPKNHNNKEVTAIAPDLNYDRWNYPKFHHKILGESFNYLLTEGIHSINTPPSPAPLDLLSLGFSMEGREFLVVFSGAVTDSTRQKSGPPFFSGIGIADELHMPLLAISDPSLALSNELTLAWYAGNCYTPDLFTNIANIIDALAVETGKTPILMGGSGGGFAAVQTLKRLKSPATALAWNPQTSIGAYYLRAVKRYVATAYPDLMFSTANSQDSDKFQEFMDANIDKTQHRLPPPSTLPPESRLIYLQNLSDDFHKSKHAGPWLKSSAFARVGNGAYLSERRNILFFVGNWGEGHAAPSATMIRELVRLAAKNHDLNNVANALEKSSFAAAQSVSWLHADGRLVSQVGILATQDEAGIHIEVQVPSRLGKAQDFEYAFEIFTGMKSISRIWYQPSSKATVPVIAKGQYRIKVYMRDSLDAIKSTAIEKEF